MLPLLRFQPGPYAMSRRLSMARWSDVAETAERGDGNLTSARVTVVGNSQGPNSIQTNFGLSFG